MANNSFAPLDLAAQLQLPVPGTLPAPEGDSSGANPFEFTVHPPPQLQEDFTVHAPDVGGPGPVVPPPVLAPQDTVPPVPTAPVIGGPTPPIQSADPVTKPVDPRSAISLPKVDQGTAPATAAGSGWSGAPVVAPEPVPSGGEFVVHPPHVPLLPKPDPEEAPFSFEQFAHQAYQAVKATALGLVDDVGQGATAAVQEYAYLTGQLKVPEGETEWSRNWDGSLRTPEQIDAAQRGVALIASTALPEAKGAELVQTAVPPSVKAKTLAWISNHVASGASAGLAYGAVAAPSTKPLDVMQSMLDNALAFAWQVPLFSGVLKGLGIPLKGGLKYSGIGPAFESAVKDLGRDGTFIIKSAVEKVENLMEQIKLEGGNPKLLPNEIKDNLLAQAVNEAKQQGPRQVFKRPTVTEIGGPSGPEGMGAPEPSASKKPFVAPSIKEVTPGTDLTPPREVDNLPEPGHEHQDRLATGVYQNPDGTVQAYGYRGVSKVPEMTEDKFGFLDWKLKDRAATEPGQMGAIFLSPHDTFAQGFGDVHYMEANFDNPLVIDDWHHNLGQDLEKRAKYFDENVAEKVPGSLYDRKFEGQSINFLGERQPGVIWAARQLGHDGIVVRHGGESVEIVALHPHKVTTSGAADYVALSSAKTLDPANKELLAATPEQQMIKSRSALNQGGVRDLGKADLTPDILPETQVRNLIEQHMRSLPGPQLYDVKQTLKPGEDLHEQYELAKLKNQTGIWKLNGRVYQAELGEPTSFGGPSGQLKMAPRQMLTVKDITGQIGVDPTLHPDVEKASLVYDGIAKGVTFQDIASHLDAEHQVIVQKILDYEPNPIEYGRITPRDRNVRTLMSAMESIENGKMDDALLQLTQPREVEFPEGSGEMIPERRAPKAELNLDKPGTVAPDGRILEETVAEHLGNAQQMKNFGLLDEAAKRVKWAFEKDPIEAERLVRENPAKYAMPNPVHLEKNKAMITPDERELLDLLRAKINENRLPMRLANDARNRPEAVRLALETQAARAQMDRMLHDIGERELGPIKEPREPTVNKAMPFDPRDVMPKREIPFQVGHVSVPPILEERPPWAPLELGTSVPQIPDDWALLHRMHGDDVGDIVANTELPGDPPRLKPKSLKSGFIPSGKREPMGATQAMTLFRIAAGGSSALMYGAAYHEDDPTKRRFMRTAAGVLAVLAAMPQKDGWMARRVSEAGKKSIDVILLKMYDLPAYLTATVGSHATETLKTAADLGNAYNFLNAMRTREIKKMFPTQQLREAGMRALDDPSNTVLWSQLTQDQQTFLAREGLFNMHQQAQLQAKGVQRDFQQDLLKHLLPRKTYGAWEQAVANPGTTTFTPAPSNPRIADIEAWAKQNKLPAPIVDLAFVQSRHMGEVGRTLMKIQMQNEMTRIGLLIPATDNIPDGWRVPSRVSGLGRVMAPEGVATALERMDKPNGDGSINQGLLRAIDDLRSWQLRTIMAWPLVHSANMIRRALSMGWKGALGTIENLQSMQLGDPSSTRGAKYGLQIAGNRTDYSTDHMNAVEALFNGLSARTGGFGKIVIQPIGNFFGMFERGLWDHLVPAVGLTGFNIHLNKWVNATGGVFAEGTPEFTAAAHRAAAFGNTMMGKSSTVLRSPGLEYAMRQAFFAPHWFESQIKINLTALGEVRGLMTGQTKLSDINYLPVKVRSTIISMAITWTLSKLLTGQPPKFNPQSEKYYARTGIMDRNGRELGIDMNGYWSDDVKMFGDPTMYFMNRLSPMLQYTHTAMTGRDAFGRVITDENLIDAGVQGLGPISAASSALARYANSPTGVDMTAADKLRSTMETTQLGSVSALPHTNDLMNQKIAHRILRINGLPADDPDKIYELQQILTAAQFGHKNPYGKQMLNWIAQQKKQEKSQYPRVVAVQHGWQHIKDALSTIGKSSRVPPTTTPPQQ